MKYFTYKINVIAQEVFQFSLVMYLMLYLIEMLKEGAVSTFFDIRIILGVVIFSGIVMVLTYHKSEISRHTTTSKEVQNGIMLVILASFGVYIMTNELGVIAISISILTGIILCLLIVLLYLDQK